MDKKEYLVTPKDGDEYTASLTDEQVSKLRAQGAIIKNPATGVKNSGLSEGNFDNGTVDAVTAGTVVGKTLLAALREHGDEIGKASIRSNRINGCMVRVTYKAKDGAEPEEDQFQFSWEDGNVKLTNLDEPLDLGPLKIVSGRATIQVDAAKAKLIEFLNQSGSNVSTGTENAPGPGDGDNLDEEWPQDHTDQSGYRTDMLAEEETLWESEESRNAFWKAADAYKAGKSRATTKELFKCARGCKKGDSLPQKIKNAVQYYTRASKDGLIPRALEEISGQMAGDAAAQAASKGRREQASNFLGYAKDALNDKEDQIVRVDTYSLTYWGDDNKRFEITRLGVVRTPNDLLWDLPVFIKRGIGRVRNKRIARAIAAWCSKYVVVVSSKEVASDWHNWVKQ